METLWTTDDLRHLKKTHETFVGIDSDGCVFDTMSVKQKQFFHPLIIEYWGLQAGEKPLRACAEFVNLYSRNRGVNRFPALLQTFELYNSHPEVVSKGLPPIETGPLKGYVGSGLALGNPSLKEYVAAHPNEPELARLLNWSLAVNDAIDARMKPVPPYRWALQALELIHSNSDSIVVSQTPECALAKEWKLHGIDRFVCLIAGQELGTKVQHLQLATQGRFDASHALMVGDALGDLKAARQAGALFYPIVPGHEEESWQRFCEEAYPRFLEGRYAGTYADKLVQDFENCLPATPPWLEP
ncbi:MAG: HAD family hydrolase [Kiritimatiellia bacterium]